MVTIWNKQTGDPRALDLVDAREYVASAPDTYTDVDPNPPAVAPVTLAPMSPQVADAFGVAANNFVQPRNPADPEGTAWRRPMHVGPGDGIAPEPDSGNRQIRGGRTGATWRVHH